MFPPSPLRRRALLSLSSAALGLLLLPRKAAAGAEKPSRAEVAPELPVLDSTTMVGKKLRVLRPNQAVTMDYSDQRVNVEIDENGIITRVRLG